MKIQEIYDKVAFHLLTQNKQSLGTDSGETICLYRAADGSQCAAGCLIRDKDYRPEMEGFVATSQPVEVAIVANIGELDDTKRRLIRDLQNIHDSRDVDGWKDELGYLARKHNLNYRILDRFWPSVSRSS